MVIANGKWQIEGSRRGMGDLVQATKVSYDLLSCKHLPDEQRRVAVFATVEPPHASARDRRVMERGGEWLRTGSR